MFRKLIRECLLLKGRGRKGKPVGGRQVELPLSRQAGLKLQWSRGAGPAVLTLVSYGSRLSLVGSS